jgi:hypothetical protein
LTGLSGASKSVSREHARVRREGWRVMPEDLGSTNGAFLNSPFPSIFHQASVGQTLA